MRKVSAILTGFLLSVIASQALALHTVGNVASAPTGINTTVPSATATMVWSGSMAFLYDPGPSPPTVYIAFYGDLYLTQDGSNAFPTSVNYKWVSGPSSRCR